MQEARSRLCTLSIAHGVVEYSLLLSWPVRFYFLACVFPRMCLPHLLSVLTLLDEPFADRVEESSCMQHSLSLLQLHEV